MATAVADREKALFVVGILAAGPEALAAATAALEDAFGLSCLGMPVRSFSRTKYYADELGPSPIRTFLVFPGFFATDRLAERKITTNRLELELASALNIPWPRPVNLDPGYLTQAKLVLASAKNFAHRIHLMQGIYAEVTLRYVDRAFRPFPWTFPDYASGDYYPFFTNARDMLVEQISRTRTAGA